MADMLRTWTPLGAAAVGMLALLAVAADEPPAQQAPAEPEIAKWVADLGHDQYLRRESATRRLTAAGPAAVQPLAEAMQSGDLEVVQRGLDVLTRIAIARPPQDDGGAWDKLSELTEQGAGAAAARAETILADIRSHRGDQARAALKAAGIVVGMDQFVVRSFAQDQLVLQIDNRWNGDEQVLPWLRWLSGVEFARIEGDAITAEVLRQATLIPDLKTIALVDGTADLETLKPLAQLRRIHSLEFRYVPLKDEYVELLASLPIRVSLDLMGTGISPRVVEQMRTRLPGLQITHRQGGFLGVQCPNTDVCQINEVVADSAAEQAGLIAGDIIVGIAGKPVKEFADLQAEIGNHMPGDQVEIEYLRGGQVKTVQLQLGRLEK